MIAWLSSTNYGMRLVGMVATRLAIVMMALYFAKVCYQHVSSLDIFRLYHVDANVRADAYMSALQQASRDKHGFDVPPPMYQAPPSDFGAYGATLDDHPVIPPDFGPYESTLDDLNGPPPLDMSALTTSVSTIPIELNSMSTIAMPPTAPRNGGNERELLRLREYEIQQRRESTSSDSSAISIDIDTYEDPPKFAVVPPIPEQQNQGGEQYHEEGVEYLIPTSARSNTTAVQSFVASRENGKKAPWTHEIDEDSETSMGASDDEEERCASVKLTPSLMAPPVHRAIDDSAEETKAQEFAETPALPPPSPSAHTATRKMLERPSIAHSSAGLLLGDPASTEIKTTEGVKPCTSKETKAIVNNPHTPSEISSTAAGKANGVLPPHERTATSPMGENCKTPALTKHLRPVSHDGISADDNMDMEGCQKPLKNRNSSADRARKEGSDVNSSTPMFTTRPNDHFATGVDLGSTTVEDAAEDLVFVGAQRNSEIARPSVQGIVEQDQTTTYAPLVIPMSVVLSALTVVA